MHALKWCSPCIIPTICYAHLSRDAASFIGCYYSYGGRLPPSGSWYYSKPCFQSGQRQYPWLGYKQEDTNSTLVHSQLPTLIISHMCHSRYVICTDVIIDKTLEWLNLLLMSEENDYKLDELQAICFKVII